MTESATAVVATVAAIKPRVPTIVGQLLTWIETESEWQAEQVHWMHPRGQYAWTPADAADLVVMRRMFEEIRAAVHARRQPTQTILVLCNDPGAIDARLETTEWIEELPDHPETGRAAPQTLGTVGFTLTGFKAGWLPPSNILAAPAAAAATKRRRDDRTASGRSRLHATDARSLQLLLLARRHA